MEALIKAAFQFMLNKSLCILNHNLTICYDFLWSDSGARAGTGVSDIVGAKAWSRSKQFNSCSNLLTSAVVLHIPNWGFVLFCLEYKYYYKKKIRKVVILVCQLPD